MNTRNVEQAKYRIKLQFAVLLNFEDLWGLMQVAYETYNIPSHKIDVWSGLMLKAEERVLAWRKYDMERFKKEFETDI